MPTKSKSPRLSLCDRIRRFPSRRFRRGYFEMLEQRQMMAVVTTDLPDYTPGSIAHIYASSFQPGEAVQFQVLHNDGTPNTGGGHLPWTVVDGSANDLDGR